MIKIKNKRLIAAFGKRVKKLRLEKKLSMRHLADLADVQYSQIVLIETGQINTTTSTAFAISKALDVPLEKLFQIEI